MDSFFVLALVTGVLALPFIKQRWSLIASYVVGGVLAVYGVATIVPALFDPNRFSGLNYIVGSIFIVVGGGMVGLARYLYRAKQSNR